MTLRSPRYRLSRPAVMAIIAILAGGFILGLALGHAYWSSPPP